jgi:hypothetical protein
MREDEALQEKIITEDNVQTIGAEIGQQPICPIMGNAGGHGTTKAVSQYICYNKRTTNLFPGSECLGSRHLEGYSGSSSVQASE